MNLRLDIVLYGNDQAEIEWIFGDVHYLNSIRHTAFSSDFILFWDVSLGMPDVALINDLLQNSSAVDAWHSGLKMGVGNLPQIMNHVEPTWMYNKDGSEDVVHTSFRLSFRCSLVRTRVFEKLKTVIEDFSTPEAAGLALGYAIIKCGGIIRYHPSLSYHHTECIDISLRDEWIFARKFYTLKWHLWILLSTPGKFRNIYAYLSTANTKFVANKPIFHRSDIEPDEQEGTVSVLAPTLNRYEYLQRELLQLNKQQHLAYEVLITDQTPEQSREELRFEEFTNLTIRYFIQHETGQCVAWNKLLQEATGDYILFLGDDADNIEPDFIKRLMNTMKHFDADMVASHVIEVGTKETLVNHFFRLTDTFPIALVKRDLLLKTGFMDMFYNKNIRADHDLAMRCHLNGALMIFDPSAVIYHHRAMKGGLRTHKARVVTNYMVKNSVTKFTVPTSSEIYLVKKYFNDQQLRAFVRIKFLNQLFISGGLFRKIVKAFYYLLRWPGLYKLYLEHKSQAEAQLSKVR
jgi:GT2 family glycosyltransferase